MRNNLVSSFLTCTAPALLLLCMPFVAVAQDAKANPTPPTPVFTMDLKAVRLRQALESLFTNAHAQYTLADDVPDSPITISVRDKSLDDALRLLLRQGSGNQRVSYTKEAGVYHIKGVAVSTELLPWEQIQLSNVRPADIEERLQASFPECVVLSTNGSPHLLVRAPADRMRPLVEMARQLDVATRSVVLKAEVVMVSGNGNLSTSNRNPGISDGKQSVLLSTILRTASGQESMGDDKIEGTPAQTAKLQLNATPSLLGDGSYQLNTRWEVSLPLATGKPAANGKSGGLVRLEKRLSNVSRIRPGETVVVGGVILSQYDLKGEILFFITLTEVSEPRAKP